MCSNILPERNMAKMYDKLLMQTQAIQTVQTIQALGRHVYSVPSCVLNFKRPLASSSVFLPPLASFFVFCLCVMSSCVFVAHACMRASSNTPPLLLTCSPVLVRLRGFACPRVFLHVVMCVCVSRHASLCILMRPNTSHCLFLLHLSISSFILRF